MRGKCCICQESLGKRNLPKSKIAVSFSWCNHGLCQGCFDRARAAIALAYGQSLPGTESQQTRLVSEGYGK